jgi:hypothetical protein
MTVAKDRMAERTSPMAVALLKSAEAGIAVTRDVGMRLLNHAQLSLEALRLRLDPATTEWVADAKRSIADGSFAERVSAQPAPSVLAAELKQARSST